MYEMTGSVDNFIVAEYNSSQNYKRRVVRAKVDFLHDNLSLLDIMQAMCKVTFIEQGSKSGRNLLGSLNLFNQILLLTTTRRVNFDPNGATL